MGFCFLYCVWLFSFFLIAESSGSWLWRRKKGLGFIREKNNDERSGENEWRRSCHGGTAYHSMDCLCCQVRERQCFQNFIVNHVLFFMACWPMLILDAALWNFHLKLLIFMLSKMFAILLKLVFNCRSSCEFLVIFYWILFISIVFIHRIIFWFYRKWCQCFI